MAEKGSVWEREEKGREKHRGEKRKKIHGEIMRNWQRGNIMKRRNIITSFLAVVAAVSLTGCGLSGENSATMTTSEMKTEPREEMTTEAETEPEEEETFGTYDTTDMPKVTLVYAELNPIDTIVGQLAMDFKTKAEELSDGKITIDVEAGGVLGSENDVLDQMFDHGGTIDMCRISAFALTSHGGQKSKILSLPYLFTSRKHFWKFAKSDLAQEILSEPQKNGFGVRGLFYGEEGFRHFFTTKKVSGIEDLKGMRIRISNDKVMNGLIEGLGAEPIAISFGELYSALQFEVVDGAEQPIANYKSNGFSEIAPNLILDGHTLGAVQAVITDEAWNRLTEDQQAIIMEAGAYASRQNRRNSEVQENKVLEELKAEGVNVVEVEDKTPWQEATRAVIEENIKGYEDLYQKIMAMQ